MKCSWCCFCTIPNRYSFLFLISCSIVSLLFFSIINILKCVTNFGWSKNVNIFTSVENIHFFRSPHSKSVYVHIKKKSQPKIAMKMITIRLKCWKCTGINILLPQITTPSQKCMFWILMKTLKILVCPFLSCTICSRIFSLFKTWLTAKCHDNHDF